MTVINPLAVLVAALAGVLLSGAYYSVLGGRLAQLSPAYGPGNNRPAAVVAFVEIVRTSLVAIALAVVTQDLGIGAAILLALVLWVAFPVVLLAGSVFHERVPAALAAIHAGDWLLKLVLVAVVVAAWR